MKNRMLLLLALTACTDPVGTPVDAQVDASLDADAVVYDAPVDAPPDVPPDATLPTCHSLGCTDEVSTEPCRSGGECSCNGTLCNPVESCAVLGCPDLQFEDEYCDTTGDCHCNGTFCNPFNDN